VATDDTRIADAASAAAFDVVMTRADHKTGTDRIAEVAHNLRAEIIVNVQGDEPLIDPATIDRVVNALLEDSTAQMATTYEPMADAADVLNPSVVKVAFGEDFYATNFSRNPIPFPNHAVDNYGSIEAALRQEPALLSSFKKHTGLYAYRRQFLLEFTRWPQSENERKESLEQLRALDRGIKISVVEAASVSIGVDTLEDLERVRAIVERQEAATGAVARP
jgi:3-deoxy-manno-octulosonate cytidylyltransferase (CMP-KDO synthetase)